MAPITPEQLEFAVQFFHPEKTLVRFADDALSDSILADIVGVEVERFCAARDRFAQRARQAATDLLVNATFAARVDRLAFAVGSTVVGLGDSITDDAQSWFEILRHLFDLRRPQDRITFVNRGVSGDTTSQMISRFLVVVDEKPDWIICMAGTNDARKHGHSPTKTLVSIEETEKNYRMLHNFAATQTSAQWVWMTPAFVIEDLIPAHWLLGQLQLNWSNDDLRAIGDVVRRQSDPFVDLQAAFGCPPDPALLLEDGLHPSLEGQKVIVKALVERLTS